MITDSTKSRNVNTGKNNTATHQLAIHQLVQSMMPSGNHFTISRSKLVAWWHFPYWCLISQKLEAGRALQGISMCDTGHVLASTVCTVHFYSHDNLLLNANCSNFSWTQYLSCGHWLSFLLHHIFLLITIIKNKKRVSPIHEKFLRCPFEIPVIPLKNDYI